MMIDASVTDLPTTANRRKGKAMNSISAPDTGEPPRESTHANAAVWLTAKRGALEVAPAPYTGPRDNQIVVRNGAVAINPVDWFVPSIGDLIYPWLNYPFILGTDVAGEVVAVGAAVSRFKVGDRVLGHAVGAEKSRNDPAEGAFQNYTVLLEHMAAPIPDAMTYENAAVLPLGISTAACGLFQKDFLALNYPSGGAKPTGKTLLVWGGSTSVGSNAIQLAVAAGYEVIATASPKNFAYVKALGAGMVFDYAAKTAVADIIEAFQGRTIAGALAIGAGSGKLCFAIVDACKGDKFVAMATPPVSFDKAPAGRRRTLWLIPKAARMIASNLSMTIRSRMRKIGVKFIWGGALMDNEVSRVIYHDFLPQALADDRYVAAPAPLVIGHGLACIPAAMQAQKNGVSARKIVVSL
jgi:NADPH:quinone reductase-like Zn-dependent oxidoreductase